MSISKRALPIRDEANALVCGVFRNGFIEELHAGKNSPLLDDPSLSRITDKEMKALMIEASIQMARLLWMRENEPERYWRQIEFFAGYCTNWDRQHVDGTTPVHRVCRTENGNVEVRAELKAAVAQDRSCTREAHHASSRDAVIR